MKRKIIKKQCTVSERIAITTFYDQYGYARTREQYPHVCKSTLYNWLNRRKNSPHGLLPDSRRPYRLKNVVNLFYEPIVNYKQKHPNAALIQIQRYLGINKKYYKPSITSIWRAIQKYKRESKNKN